MRRSILFALVIAGSLGLGGCFLFHDDYPDDSCETTDDCFAAQGEVCNIETNTCEVPADAGPTIDADTTDAPPTPDAGPTPDAATPTLDATPTPDAT